MIAIIEKRTKKVNSNSHVCLVIFAYWVLLLIWQTIRNVGNRSVFDMLIKFGLMAVLILYSAYMNRKNKFSVWKLIIAVAYMACQLITLLVNDQRLSLSITTPLFSIVLSLVFIVLMDGFTINTRELLIFLNLFLFCVLIMSVYNLLFLWPQFVRLFSVSQSYGNEMSSFLSSNQEFALYLVLGTISCIMCLRINPGHRLSVCYYILIALFSINLISTFSRTSMLALLVFLTLYLYSSNKKIFFVYLFLICIILVIVLNNPVIEHYVITVILKNNTDAGRTDLLNGGVLLFNSQNLINKIFGIGYDNTTYNALQITGNSSFHNGYLSILLDGGLMMFLFFSIIICHSVKISLKCLKYDPFFGSVFLGLIVLMLIYMATNTPIPFFSSIDSFIITVFSILLPKYYENYLEVSRTNLSNNSNTNKYVQMEGTVNY